jgi:ADP-heptose:LPS heptosyltransferase
MAKGQQLNMKILIIRFSSIGDIVLTTPVIRCLKQQLNCEIHYFTKKSFYDVLKHNPYIDQIHLLKEDININLNELKAHNFDYIIDLHHNLRSLRVKRSLGKPSSSFNKLNFEKWMMVNFKWNLLPPVHIVDRYLETAKSLGVQNDHKGLDYFISAEEEIDISTLPLTHQNGYIGFAIGAQHATKRLPKEKIADICKKINKPVILLGGKEDIATADFIQQQVGEKVINACGKYSINQSASLVKQAEKLITHDTGLMHIAAAFDKEIISIWGNTIPGFGMSPYKTSRSPIIEIGLSCRPCSKIGYDKCPKGHFKCMRLINDTDIADIANL